MVPSYVSIAETGDFPGDSTGDVLRRDNTTGAVGIWFMNGMQIR
jgi:hypothetical protein